MAYFHGNSLKEYPAYTHTWANMDRMALARGFVRNDLNFFQAQNYLLNHQYPDFWVTPTESTRTSVEFPIHDYIPAIFMKISGNHGPLLFHGYIFMMSFLGLLFLFKLAMKLTDHVWKSFWVVAFAALSPVYTFYQGGFLPTIPCLTLTVLGMYYYTLYYENGNRRYYSWMIFFMTIAVLSRSTYAIPFLAILGFEFIRILRKKSKLVPLLPPTALSMLFIGSSLYYNALVRKVYGSDFLNELLPAKSWQDLKNTWVHMYEMWKYAYLTKTHYLTFFVVTLLAMAGWFGSRFKMKSKTDNLIGLVVIWLVGVLLFWVLMNQQFWVHDYYFLDTFYLPLVLFFTLMLAQMPKLSFRFSHWILPIVVLIFVGLAFKNDRNFQTERRVFLDYDKMTGNLINFQDSETWLDELHVSKSAKMLVLDASAPNIPFILMNRVGYCGKELQSKEDFERVLNFNWDYTVVQKAYFLDDIYAKYPEILNRIKPIAQNDRLILCQRKHDTIPQEVSDFFALKQEIGTFKLGRGVNTKGLFKEVQFAENPTNPNQRVIEINPNREFSLDVNFGKMVPLDRTLGIQVNLKKYTRDLKNVFLIFVVSNDEGTKFYKSLTISDNLNLEAYWSERSWMFVLPQMNEDDLKFGCYVYNPEKSHLYLDELEIKIFSNK